MTPIQHSLQLPFSEKSGKSSSSSNRKSPPYASFIEGEDAIARDWMYSQIISPLQVDIPGGCDWTILNSGREQCVTGNVENFDLIAFNTNDLKLVYDKSPGTTFVRIRIDKKSMEQCEWEETFDDEGNTIGIDLNVSDIRYNE